MRLYIFITSLLVCLSLSSETFTGKVVQVVDGNTIMVLDSTNIQHKIRLDGIDTPEKDQPYGSKATYFLRNLIGGKNVKIEWNKKNRSGRILGYVYIGKINVNKLLLKKGLAWHYKFSNSNLELADLESKARIQKLNIWSDPKPIEPYYWRRGKRN